MAACLAALNGTRLAALLLTAGVEPDPRVWELARAGDRDRAARPAHGQSTYETAMQVHDLEVDLSADDLERAEQVMVDGRRRARRRLARRPARPGPRTGG